MKKLKIKIEELTFFRFIAAAIIVIFHYGRDATGFTGVLISGPQMVSFFFVLSGFVMGLSYFNVEVKKGAYWWARIARIMPLYLLALSLMALFSKIYGCQLNSLSLILNLLLLQSWVSPHPLSINYPAWAISVEAFFYFIFPFLIQVIQSYRVSAKQMMLISLTLWLITQILTTVIMSTGLYAGFPSFSHDLVFYFPLIHFCSFIMGVSGSMWIRNSKFVIKNNVISFLLVGLSVFIIVVTLNKQYALNSFFGLNLPFGSSFFAPMFLVFIIVLSVCRSKSLKILSIKPFVVLGEASFAMYILQAPAHTIYNLIAGKLNLPPLLDFSVFFGFLVLMSIMTMLCFEKPANNFLRYSVPGIIKTMRLDKFIYRG